MLIKLNKNALYVNFNKHNLFVAYLTYKFYQNREYIVISIIPIGGIPLHSKQNNLTYYSTGKK